MKLKELKYTMKLRNVLSKASIDEIKLTKQECNRELERRNKKK